MQRIKLALRGWQRRRDEREREFVEKNTGWGNTPVPPTVTTAKAQSEIDLEGLQCAYLDDSGQLAHFLDLETGEVIERRSGDAPPEGHRYARVPSRNERSDAEDRRAFVASREMSASLDSVAHAVDDPEAFRAAIAKDRALERAWYNYKNDRALTLVKEWSAGVRAGKR